MRMLTKLFFVTTFYNQRRSVDNAQKRHDNVMRMLVRRYVTAEQRKRDDFGITEDDVMEIRQDISTLRYELVDILRNNGMKTPQVKQADCEWFGRRSGLVWQDGDLIAMMFSSGR